MTDEVFVIRVVITTEQSYWLAEFQQATRFPIDAKKFPTYGEAKDYMEGADIGGTTYFQIEKIFVVEKR
jgi:hypothetical protein